MEETKKPAIRFNGFTDEWDQRKLSALCDKFIDGDWIESKDQSDSGVRLVQTGNIGIAEYLDKPNNKKWISDITFEQLHCEEVLPGDILISRLPEPAGRACIMPFLGTKMITAVDCTIVRTASNVSNKFLVQYLSSQYYFDAVNTCLAGGTRQRISRSNLADFDIPIPSEKVEQDAIGSFFNGVDNLITLNQCKYDKLLTFKKSMLEKMFPQNGAKVPEVRFAGFDGEWVEYRFGDIVAKYSDPVATPTNGYTRLGIRSHGKGTFHSAVLPGMELETAQMHRVAANNFIVNITFGWEHAVAVTDENDEGKLVSHRFPQYSFNEGAIPKFFKYLILDEKFRQHLELASPGGAGRNRVLKLDDMLEYQFMLPSVPEQESIADYLIKLDDLIQLKQSELEKLKNIKSALLEKMFV